MPGSVGLTVPCLAHGVTQQGQGIRAGLTCSVWVSRKRSDANAAAKAHNPSSCGPEPKTKLAPCKPVLCPDAAKPKP